jgi:hypothetical protein
LENELLSRDAATHQVEFIPFRNHAQIRSELVTNVGRHSIENISDVGVECPSVSHFTRPDWADLRLVTLGACSRPVKLSLPLSLQFG